MTPWTWRRRGPIMVAAPVTPPPVTPRPTLRACPVCRAPIDQSCRTKTGNRRSPHPTRIVDRRCPCGSPVAAHRKLCEPCRRETRRTRPRPNRNRARDERRRLARL